MNQRMPQNRALLAPPTLVCFLLPLEPLGFPPRREGEMKAVASPVLDDTRSAPVEFQSATTITNAGRGD